MNRPNRSANTRAADRTGPSRRTLLRTGAWTAPVVAVAATAPAFASSMGITGTQQAVRSDATSVDSSGTVTNNTGASVTVTLTWTWLCDSTGSGAGRFTSGSGQATGWNVSSFVFISSGGDSQRGARLVVSRVVAGGTTVPFPTITMEPSSAKVTGTVTATLSAAASVTVVQPAVVAFTAYTSARRAPAPRTKPGQPSDVITLGP